MAAVERPRIVGAGHAEAGWRASAWVAGLGQRTDAEVLDGHRRLVVVSPHPDDETLACGGLMRAATLAGRELLVVAVTDGEACYPDGQEWTADRLRRVRPQELEDALDTLGARGSIDRLGLPDGAVARHADELLSALRDRLVPGDLVLAPWQHDGHPDHDAAGRAAIAAAPTRGARLLRYPVWAWHWLDPDAPRAPFRAFRMPLDAQARTRKQEAIRCFTSQIAPGGPAPILPDHVLARFDRPFEVYLP